MEHIKTEFIKIDPLRPDHEAIARAANALLRGELVAFPTETVYGLGGNATDPLAAQKIYKAKGRPSDNPLIIHVADPADAAQYAFVPPLYHKLADAFMPGPLTVIMPKRDIVPDSVTGGLKTVAIRCPSHPIAHELIVSCGVAIAAPSANRSGSPSPTVAQHVLEDLDGRIHMIIDGGASEIGLESTIVRVEDNHITLLRPGAITYDALCCICDNVTVAAAVTDTIAENERPLSPGMKYRHYAPRAPLILLDGDDSCVIRHMRHMQNAEHCAILCYEEDLPHLRNERLIVIGKRNDLATQASKLFSALRQTNEMDVSTVYAHLPPKNGLGLALYNRLIRAAAHTIIHV